MREHGSDGTVASAREPASPRPSKGRLAAIAVLGGLIGGLLVIVGGMGLARAIGRRHGDIITAVDGTPATSVAPLEVAALTREAGDAVEVTYSRDGTSTTTDVTLGVGA